MTKINCFICPGIDVSSPTNDDQLLIETSNKHFAPIVPPRNLQNQINSTLEALKPSVGTKLEGLLLNSDSDSDFDPRADENDMIMNGNGIGEKFANDSFFGFEPPKPTLGQQLFAVNNNNNNNTNNNNNQNNTNNNANQNGLTNGSSNGNGYNNGTTNSSPPLCKRLVFFLVNFEPILILFMYFEPQWPHHQRQLYHVVLCPLTVMPPIMELIMEPIMEPMEIKICLAQHHLIPHCNQAHSM